MATECMPPDRGRTPSLSIVALRIQIINHAFLLTALRGPASTIVHFTCLSVYIKTLTKESESRQYSNRYNPVYIRYQISDNIFQLIFMLVAVCMQYALENF